MANQGRARPFCAEKHGLAQIEKEYLKKKNSPNFRWLHVSGHCAMTIDRDGSSFSSSFTEWMYLR